MSEALTREIAKLSAGTLLHPLFLFGMIREGGLRRGLALWLVIVGGLAMAAPTLIGRAVRRQWNREATEAEAVNLFRIGLPVGLAAILLAIGLGFGL